MQTLAYDSLQKNPEKVEDSSYNSVLYNTKDQLKQLILYSDKGNSFQEIREKKKREVDLVGENVGNVQTDVRDSIVVLRHIALTVLVASASKVSYELHLDVAQVAHVLSL